MFQKMITALRGGQRPAQINDERARRSDALDTQDIEKYKNNLKTINYQDLLNFIVQEEIYKIDHDKPNVNSNPLVIDQDDHNDYTLIEDNEDDHYPITVEEEYRFVLVKKAKPKPTLVMPTKILKQLQDPSDQQQ